MRIARFWPVVLAAVALAPARAEAQFRSGRGPVGLGFGGGFGFGFGFSPYYYSPGRPEPLLYQRAMLNASRATMGPVTHNVYAGHPAAYVYHLHDPGYLDGYDVATRRRIEARIGRFSDGPPPADPAAPRARAGPEAVPPAPRPAADPGPGGPMP